MEQNQKYRLVRENGNYLLLCNMYTIFNTIFLCWTILRGIDTQEFEMDNIVISIVVYLLFFVFYWRYFGPKIKAKIVCKYGTKLKGEIIGCKYWNDYAYVQYYLEIAYTDSRGRERIHKTLAYDGNPNQYLESTHCSIYEWKGLHVEGDFRMRKKWDPFGNIGVYCRKVHFTIR